MSVNDNPRPLPERGQQHFEWVPDEPIERAITQAETAYGKRGQAIQAVWAPAKRYKETTRHTLADRRTIEVFPHPRVPEWHIVVELVTSEEAAEAASER